MGENNGNGKGSLAERFRALGKVAAPVVPEVAVKKTAVPEKEEIPLTEKALWDALAKKNAAGESTNTFGQGGKFGKAKDTTR